jgi:micrococcal nuclease
MRGTVAMLIGLLSCPALADEWPPCTRSTRTMCVVDGDTIRLAAGPVRLMGFDTPEMRGKCLFERRKAQAASTRLAEILGAGYLTFEWHGRGRYGRRLAIARVGGRDIATILIAEGLARPYFGARRKGWC